MTKAETPEEIAEKQRIADLKAAGYHPSYHGPNATAESLLAIKAEVHAQHERSLDQFRAAKVAPKSYYVYGGHYSNFKFTTVEIPAEFGPFDTYQDAYVVWKEHMWLNIDDAQYRLDIALS